MHKDLFFIKKMEDTLRYYTQPLVSEEIQTNITKSLYDAYNNANEAYNAPIMETEIPGLKLDFNFGLRLEVPKGKYHVKISDAMSKMVFYDKNVSEMQIYSFEKDYVKWKVEVKLKGKPIYEHVLDMTDKPVLICFNRRTMGDLLSFVPYFGEFRDTYKCKLKLLVTGYMREFVKNLYPDIPQVEKLTYDNYATYYPLLGAGTFRVQFDDTGLFPMLDAGKMIFGLHYKPKNPKFTPTKPREIQEPYVCIACQASGTRKGWHYNDGWNTVIRYLKSLGYRVLCIDKNKEETESDPKFAKYKITMPEEAEDFTGRSILECANLFYHADFFMGLSSGLGWLADSVNCPVIMIAGYTKNWYEFYTPYRVTNYYACNGCFNDIGRPFLTKGCLHVGRPRELECQKLIHPDMVIEAIDRLIRDKNSDSLYVRRDL